jgi:hypothetical protein
VGTDREQLLQAQQEVEMAKQQKEDAEQKAARLAEKLRELSLIYYDFNLI